MVCFATAAKSQQRRAKMVANQQERLEFVHRTVTNWYSEGRKESIRNLLVSLGGLSYITSILGLLKESNLLKRNQLANLAFIWWRTTGDIRGRELAKNIWLGLVEEADYWTHAVKMLGYITAGSDDASVTEIRTHIANLRKVRQQSADADDANRTSELATKLGQKYFEGCKKEK